MLNAIDQVVRILALEPLVKGERLQAGEADEISVPDKFCPDTGPSEEFGLDLSRLIQVEDDRRMRYIQGRDLTVRRQGLHLAASDLWGVGKQFENHQGAVLCPSLPAP